MTNWRGSVLRHGLKAAIALALIAGLAPKQIRAAAGVPVGDAHVDATNTTQNFGSAPALSVGNGNLAFLQLDISSLPPGTTADNITKVTLILYVNQVPAAGALDFAQVTSAWTEGTVTFATQPTISSPMSTVAVGSPQSFISVDVTPMVQQWLLNPQINFGISISASAGSPGTAARAQPDQPV
ncbi:MAG: Collagen triple helix repeat-containing protein [Bryobacterales bacterium]|nr:Collagen triple helix repeat-containing protein [Bryobacterales bacterium]